MSDSEITGPEFIKAIKGVAIRFNINGTPFVVVARNRSELRKYWEKIGAAYQIDVSKLRRVLVVNASTVEKL